jgi:hypothetical protein
MVIISENEHFVTLSGYNAPFQETFHIGIGR